MTLFTWIVAAVMTVCQALFPQVSPTRLMVDEARVVGMALEQWGVDHHRYPTDQEFATAITRGNYLPGNRARNWFEGQESTCPLIADPAAALPNGTRAPQRFRLGTILYHLPPKAGAYALAVVVRRNQKVVIETVSARG